MNNLKTVLKIFETVMNGFALKMMARDVQTIPREFNLSCISLEALVQPYMDLISICFSCYKILQMPAYHTTSS